jgi:hypothetical protein
MKQKIIALIVLALFAGAIAFNVHTNANQNQTSRVTLENIEAMAMGSEDYHEIYCCWAVMDPSMQCVGCFLNIHKAAVLDYDCSCGYS